MRRGTMAINIRAIQIGSSKIANASISNQTITLTRQFEYLKWFLQQLQSKNNAISPTIPPNTNTMGNNTKTSTNINTRHNSNFTNPQLRAY